ncbi:MAG: T9SS type A sorting domain-containing protein [Bacteroidetes bacterium]|nr:T9SS type A sorting domain-containing protein [Bacteroidota bacterium]
MQQKTSSEIDVSTFSKGMYFVKISDEMDAIIKRILIQ